MNNLSETQRNAKQAYLNQRVEQTVALYEKADKSERNAIIKHIDSFLSTESKESKTFWLKVRQRLERLNE